VVRRVLAYFDFYALFFRVFPCASVAIQTAVGMARVLKAALRSAKIFHAPGDFIYGIAKTLGKG
jgi:hypothetical protein